MIIPILFGVGAVAVIVGIMVYGPTADRDSALGEIQRSVSGLATVFRVGKAIDAIEIAQEIGGETFAAALEFTAREESNLNWGAWNPNYGKDYGVAVGIIQFNQGHGSLWYIINEAYKQNPELVKSIFSEYTINVTDRNKIKGLDFNETRLKAMTLNFLQREDFKRIQIQHAYDEYWVNRLVNKVDSTQATTDYLIFGYSLTVLNPVTWTQYYFDNYKTVDDLYKAVIEYDPEHAGRHTRVYGYIKGRGLLSSPEEQAKKNEELKGLDDSRDHYYE